MKNKDLICENLNIDSSGVLTFNGLNTLSLAQKYGTPLFLMDEDRIIKNILTYKNAISSCFGDNGGVLYASKALSFKQIYRIAKQLEIGIDVVSSGEIYTALSVGFPLENAFFHSNNKTDEDISYAIDNKIGYFVVDNSEELISINKIAGEKGCVQKVLLRITPGIDPHTYEAISTGKVDSKFGSAIETGQAEEITKLALSLENITLCGFHCHVGSQVFDSEVYLKASQVMLEFVSDMYKKFGFVTKILDIGGGFGVRYISSEPTIDIQKNLENVANFIKETVKNLNIPMPKIMFEPGRSIVADAGLTLYTVGTVKRISGYKNYVSIDGGMADNPRFALYRSNYTVVPAYNMNLEKDMLCSVVGRCCESGDIIQENVLMPSSIKRGDIIACLTTGAYNYAMSSNYNRLAKPPIVMIKDGKDYLAVKRESLEDITKNDI